MEYESDSLSLSLSPSNIDVLFVEMVEAARDPLELEDTYVLEELNKKMPMNFDIFTE